MSSLPCVPEIFHIMRSLAAINSAGLLDELRETIATARYEWRRNRNDQPIGFNPMADLLASDLAKFTSEPRERYRQAMREALAPTWEAACFAEILNFHHERLGQRRAG